MIKSKLEIELLPDNSTNIFKKSITDRYMDRPICGNSASLKTVCLAQFASLYCKKTSSDNDYQPNILEENIEKENDCNTALRKKIVVKKSREVMIRRNQKLVLRYYKPNRQLYPEKFAYHVLLLFYPFINESDLFSKDGVYSSKLLEPLVSATVNQTRQIFEPNSELTDSFLLEISKQDQEEYRYDDMQEHDNQEIESSEHESSPGSIGQSHREPDISYEELSRLILSLNFQQRKIFNEAQDWATKKIKARNCNKKVSVDPLWLFITGRAGVGKSLLMKTICMFLTKTFNLYSGSPDKPKVLILSPTGVAAFNINGTTINSGLSIPSYVNEYTLPGISDSEQGRLRNLYSEVLVNLIDKISMVSNIRLSHIHKRLCEIFDGSESQPFANLSILAVGDLLQVATNYLVVICNGRID